MPKWFELRTVAERGAVALAFSITASIARLPAGWPRPLPASSTSDVGVSRTTSRSGSASSFPLRMRLDVVRLEPRDAVRSMPRRSAATKTSATVAASAGGNADLLQHLGDEALEFGSVEKPVFGIHDGDVRHGNLPFDAPVMFSLRRLALGSARANRSTVAPLVEIPKWKTSLSMPSRANSACIAAPIASPLARRRAR